MSRINPLAKESVTYQKKIQKLNKHHQENINRIKKEQAIQKNEIKNANSLELQNLRSEHDTKLTEEILRKDQVLADIKDQINKTKEFTDRELKTIKETNQQQTMNENTNFKIRYKDNSIENEDKIESINEQYSKKIKDLHRENSTELDQISIDNSLKKRKVYLSNQNQLNNITDQHQQLMHNKQEKNEVAVERQRLELNKDIGELKAKHHRSVEDKTQDYNKKMTVIKEQHQSQVKEENERFLKKFSDVKQVNENRIKNIDDKTEEILEDIQKRFANDVNVQLEKLKDEFYHTRKIKPLVTDNIDHYEIKLEIPKYEVKNIQLTGNKRDLKISMSRNLDQTIKENNMKAQTKRVETHVIEVKVDELVNGKKLTQEYKDNHLIFKIAKL